MSLGLVWGALAIFCLRIVDVSIGTVKLLYVVRGQRVLSAILAFFESLVWVLAASLVFSQLDNPWNMLGFCAGFAAGTAVGMTIERWIGSGYVLIRIITRLEPSEWLQPLRTSGFGLTAVQGQGSEGSVQVILIVSQRKRTETALKLIQLLDPKAFVTVDPISHASGGYLLPTAVPSALRK